MATQHPTVGNLGMGGGFPAEGTPARQGAGVAYGQPAQTQIGGAAPGQYGYQGQVPVNQGPQQFQQQPQPQQQQFQPHPTVPYGQEFDQPGYRSQQPQGQPQQRHQQVSLQGDEILDGPAIPPELRGRRFNEVASVYNRLLDHWQRTRHQRSQSQDQGQGQGQQGGQQPQFGRPQQPIGGDGRPTQQPDRSFWKNPDETIKGWVRDAVQEATAPVQQHTLQQAIRETEQQAMRSIPDFQQIRGDMLEIMAGAQPEHLANPEYWNNAADLARGRYYRRQMSQQQGGEQPQYGGAYGQPYQGGAQPQPPQQPWGQAAPATQGFPQPTYQFFSEGPTPPGPGMALGGADLSPMQLEVAQKMGLSPDQYKAWQGGVQNGRRARGGWGY